jgi:hypothetical protein
MHKRVRLELPAFRRNTWTESDERVVRTGTVHEAARRLRRSLTSVRHKRARLGLHAIRPNIWTEAEKRLLRTATDREVARRLGRTLFAVKAKRQRLGLPPVGSSWKRRPGKKKRAAAGAS